MRYSFLFLLLFAVACSPLKSPAPPIAIGAPPEAHNFYLGTYDGDHAPGIYHFTLSPDGMLTNNGLRATASNPSYLALSADKRTLLAVEEEQQGQVRSFRIGAGGLAYLNRQPTRGAHPCHVAVDAAGAVVVSNYTGGNLASYLLDENGLLSPPLSTADHRRLGAEAPHAHSAYFLAGDRVLSADLGTDAVWRYRMTDGRLDPLTPQKIDLPGGAGPRHIALHPNGRWAYVINEYGGSITQLTGVDTGVPTAGPTVPTLPPDYTGENKCADIVITADGRYLYGSNRGHNSIAAFRIDATDGHLSPLGHESVRGDWPRNIALSPDDRYLLVANQKSNDISTFALTDTGVLNYVTTSTAPTPVCIVFD